MEKMCKKFSKKIFYQNQKLNLKKENGITLIALVVTIVVLLILAGVTITMVLGEDGIIAQAKLAAEKTKEAEEKQAQDLKNLEEQLDYILDDGGTGGGETTTPTPEPTPNEIAKEYGKRQDENKQVSDGNPDGEKSMWIPAGYTVVDPKTKENVSYAENNNPKIDEGIVIADDDGNEFVWVPVPNPNEMYGEDSNGNYLGKLYDFGTSTNPKGPLTPLNWQEEGGKISWKIATDTGSNREPDVVTGNGSEYDAVNTNLEKVLDNYVSGKTSEDLKKQLQKEFKEMIESVRKYGGFYIGRYETSGLKETENPAVKAGEVPTNKTDWYTMYKNSKELAKEGVTSSMIWGSQWDRVMNWFLSDSDQNTKKYVTNSEGMGWYSDNKTKNSEHKTGVDLTEEGTGEVLNRVKNIYDMAGNMREWTIEAIDAYNRVDRGGFYYNSGSNGPASNRDFYNPTGTYDNLGSRATLYVNLKTST